MTVASVALLKRRRQSRSTRAQLTAFDLCAGIGGFRAGLAAVANADVQFVGSCEIDPHSIRTYRAMFDCSDEFHVADLRSITRLAGEEGSSRLSSRMQRLRKIRDSLPAFSLLTAGFPCQPHSLMGNRRGLHDERGSLFYDIAEVVRAMEPRTFILENVRAIKSVNGGTLYKEMLHVLQQDLGYNLRVWELNAADFGVPQTRRRLFFVGSRGALPSKPPAPVPLESSIYPTVWHLLEREVDRRYFLSERILKTILKHEHKGYRRKAEINRLIARPLTRTMHKMHRASQDNYYSVDFINGQFDPQSGVVIHAAAGSDRIRRLTPREALRIQSFSEDYVQRALDSGTSDTQLYMQAGNAVPGAMVRAVVEHVLAEGE